MHEYSVVRMLMELVQEIAQRNAAQAVAEVVVAVGPLSGIEPLLLQSAFQQMATSTLLQRARLTIEEVAVTIQCDSCSRQSTLHDFDFTCHHCGSSRTQVVSGEDLMLRHVTLQVPAAEGEES
jgi:hydrogenase nickel incorporation protein HypA/HybF